MPRKGRNHTNKARLRHKGTQSQPKAKQNRQAATKAKQRGNKNKNKAKQQCSSSRPRRICRTAKQILQKQQKTPSS
jgi:hypothetical protein